MTLSTSQEKVDAIKLLAWDHYFVRHETNIIFLRIVPLK